MKKIILCVLGVLLTAALIFVVVWFSGQRNVNPPKPNISSSPTTSSSGTYDPTDTSKPVIQISTPMVSISLPIIVETDTADDGTVIFKRTFQDVVLSIPDADITKTVTLDLLRRMDANSATLSSLQQSAFADYSGQTPWMPYYYKILYSPMRMDQTVLSLYGVEDVFGNMQAGQNGISVTYNLATGSAMTLAGVLTEESTAADTLLAALLAALESEKEEYMLFDDYAQIVSSRFQTQLQQESGWYLSGEGLCFFFSPYDIAPNAAGTVVATVPYTELNGVLQNIYFPAEQANYEGTLAAMPFDSENLDGFTHFSELITNPDAPRYLLHTEGVLYDLTVEQGQWIAGVRFQKDATVYSANLLAPESAFVLRAILPESQSSLRISYHNSGNDYCFYLTVDSTGNMVFTPVA